MDIETLSEGSRCIMIILMLTGGAPGSTAGGIKTTTAFAPVSYTHLPHRAGAAQESRLSGHDGQDHGGDGLRDCPVDGALPLAARDDHEPRGRPDEMCIRDRAETAGKPEDGEKAEKKAEEKAEEKKEAKEADSHEENERDIKGDH